MNKEVLKCFRRQSQAQHGDKGMLRFEGDAHRVKSEPGASRSPFVVVYLLC